MSIEELMGEGRELLCIKEYKAARLAWDIWCEKLNIFIADGQLSAEQAQCLKVKMHFVENEYSQIDNEKALKAAVENIISFLKIACKEDNIVVQKSEIEMIERVLEKFYLHLHAMYQAPVHGKGTLRQEDLQRIQPGNEYDVQRMLYALLLPMFPELRMEVNGDNGYSGMRADLYLEKYDLIIEVKCTRKSMTEKRLTEELGADAFHYRARKLFIFVYDKESMIENAEAYKAAFKRDYEKDGQTVKMYIIQPVQL